MTRDPEWDDEQREWALALQLSEDMRCPVCGGPREECTDPANESRWIGTGPIRCHRATATSMQQARYFGAVDEAPAHSDALLWGIKERN